MIIVNTPEIHNKKITETLGIARGSTVRARNVGQDIFAGLKNIIGGEISEYTKLQGPVPRTSPAAHDRRCRAYGCQCHCKRPPHHLYGHARLL
jgi:hypothetical protein